MFPLRRPVPYLRTAGPSPQLDRFIPPARPCAILPGSLLSLPYNSKMGESSMPRLRSATLVIGILALTAGAPGQKSYQEGLKAAMAKAGDKPVLIDFHAVW